MKRIDILKRAGRSLSQAKSRTILTSLAIAVGAFTLTLSIAAGEGSREYADKLIGTNINPQQLYITKDESLLVGSGGPRRNDSGIEKYDSTTVSATGYGGQSYTLLTNADLKQLSSNSDLEAVVPLFELSLKYFTIEGNNTKYTAQLNAYDDGVLNDVAAGALPKIGTQISDSQIVIPESYAKTLGLSPEKLIGKKVTLTFERPAQAPTEEQIASILSTQGTAGLSELAKGQTKTQTYTISAVTKKSSTALMPSNAMMASSNQARIINDFMTQGTSTYGQFYGATARAKDGVDPEQVKVSLVKEGYSVNTAKDVQNLLFTIVNILQGIVIGFGVIALIASVFGIINTQYISVLERTSQIGLMKALGMRGKDIAKLFRYEAAWIGFLGGVIGAGIALIAGTLLNPWITKQLSLGAGNYLLIFKPLPIAALILILVIIAVIAGYLPARKAAKLDPIEALRTE